MTNANCKPVASRQNPNFKRWLSLLDSRGGQKYLQALTSGRKIVPELLTQNANQFLEIIYSDAHNISLASPQSQIVSYTLPQGLFRELDVFGTDFPLGVVRISSLPFVDLTLPPQGLELVLATSDPANLGGLLRSSEAFQTKRVILLKESASFFHPRTIKSSAGSSLRMSWRETGGLAKGPSIKDLVGAQNVLALDLKGEALSEYEFPKDVRLLLGEEGQGLPAEILPVKRLKIPLAPGVDSLNALAAASIALYAYRVHHPL